MSASEEIHSNGAGNFDFNIKAPGCNNNGTKTNGSTAAMRETWDASDLPFVVEKDAQFGQYLKATRDIPAGSVILEEPYAFYGPSADYVEDYSTPICLGCAVVMNDGNETSRCSRCKWPLCGPSCDKVSGGGGALVHMSQV
jgi:hypothetical protein